MSNTQDRRSAYLEKLRDPRWQKRRLQIFERDGWCCQFCGAADKTLHVHHRWYDPGEPWESGDTALVTVCEPCHELEGRRSTFDALLLSALRKHFSSGDIGWLAMVLDDVPIVQTAQGRVELLEALTAVVVFPDIREEAVREYQRRPVPSPGVRTDG